MSDRAAVIAEALSLGYSEDTVARLPTYTIEKMINDHKSSRVKKDSRRSRTEEKKTIIQNELLSVSGLAKKLESNNVKDDDDDGNATVVDMSFVTSTTNPADQKYQRFKFLVCARNEITNAIKVNTSLKNANSEKLDADDIYVIDKEVKTLQNNLGLVLTEMRELQVWFNEVNSQKKVFYEKLSSRLVDMSGTLADHFSKKVENIDSYLKTLHEDSKQMV
jgi:hypothetical protein